jgi:AhpD family alkylhydroperoxidase
MEQRINIYEKFPSAIKPFFAIGKYLSKSSIEKSLQQLVEFRVSQINGCAYCLDMHSKDLRAGGEKEQRLYLVSAWRESTFFTERERAALEWTEAVTHLTGGQVTDQVYEIARSEFSEQELIDLTLAIIGTSCYNRLNIAFRTPAGSYQPGQFNSLLKEEAAV